jgi:hypothetical protein
LFDPFLVHEFCSTKKRFVCRIRHFDSTPKVVFTVHEPYYSLLSLSRLISFNSLFVVRFSQFDIANIVSFFASNADSDFDSRIDPRSIGSQPRIRRLEPLSLAHNSCSIQSRQNCYIRLLLLSFDNSCLVSRDRFSSNSRFPPPQSIVRFHMKNKLKSKIRRSGYLRFSVVCGRLCCSDAFDFKSNDFIKKKFFFETFKLTRFHFQFVQIAFLYFPSLRFGTKAISRRTIMMVRTCRFSSNRSIIEFQLKSNCQDDQNGGKSRYVLITTHHRPITDPNLIRFLAFDQSSFPACCASTNHSDSLNAVVIRTLLQLVVVRDHFESLSHSLSLSLSLGTASTSNANRKLRQSHSILTRLSAF